MIGQMLLATIVGLVVFSLVTTVVYALPTMGLALLDKIVWNRMEVHGSWAAVAARWILIVAFMAGLVMGFIGFLVSFNP